MREEEMFAAVDRFVDDIPPLQSRVILYGMEWWIHEYVNDGKGVLLRSHRPPYCLSLSTEYMLEQLKQLQTF